MHVLIMDSTVSGTDHLMCSRFIDGVNIDGIDFIQTFARDNIDG